MGYDDPGRDEDGELIFDPDAQSDREASPVAALNDWEDEPQGSPEPEPPMEEEEVVVKAKPRKRLIKKSAAVTDEEDGGEEPQKPQKKRNKEPAEGGGSGEPSKKHRKSKEGGGGGGKRPKEGGRKGKGKSEKSSGSKPSRADKRGDTEMREMWDSLVGNDSEEDNDGTRTNADDAFIDDAGVELEERLVSDDDETGSIGDAPQAEEGEDDDELGKLFKSGKKKNKYERTAEETAMLVEQFMARLEVAAEEDAELNRQSKPAINKLKMLSMLVNILSKRQLQQEFLDRGILSVLKNWLEPLPDGSLPNINIRMALLKILHDLPIDVELYDRREQLKKSGLGKVIMFLSRSDEETVSNRKLAKDLVDKWSRPIFQKSTRFEHLRSIDEERTPMQRPPPKKPTPKPRQGFESRGGDDLDLVDLSDEPRPGQPGYRMHASRPEAVTMDFLVRPASKIDAEEARARARSLKQSELRNKMNKKLQQLKSSKKKKLQAAKVSVEGRGLVKYF